MDKGLIFLVEDDDSILYNLELLLSINNYSVKSFSNAPDALNYLIHSESYPELIISDILMPEMNGYEFIQRVKQMDSAITIPFIFISALCYEKDIMKGKDLGAIAYLKKPIQEEKLLKTIEEEMFHRQSLNSKESPTYLGEAYNNE